MTPTLVPVQFKDYLSQKEVTFDSLVFVAPSSGLETLDSATHPFLEALQVSHTVDESSKSKLSFHISPQLPNLAHRLVVSPLGRIDRDQDDVRRFGDAARAGVLRAKQAGSTSPLLLLPPTPAQYPHAFEVALLSVLAALYEPLQAREFNNNTSEVVKTLGFVVYEGQQGATIAKTVAAIEAGRRIGRDIGGGDPERMSAVNAANYIKDAFSGSDVKVTVVDDLDKIKKGYPLLHAVARASLLVSRHHPRVVRLEYTGQGETEETLLFAGKGVTFDTGGADIKAGGIMAGMSRDKIGAASIVSLFKVLEQLKPKGIKAIAELGFVRNSVGSEAYVADEIILSHGKKRVLVGNTDAEGRMVLADCLSHLRKTILKHNLPSPKIFTCATLTGHAVRAVGNYTITLDNGAAKKERISASLKEIAEAWGDPIEVSSLRKEDFDVIAPRNSVYDILQCNNAASSATMRGHQFPAAFLILASGLDEHSGNSAKPLPFTHVDIAGGAVEGCDYQFGIVTATPTVAWTARFVLPRLKN